MQIEHLVPAGVILLTPALHQDERGSFMESYNKARFDEAIGRAVDFVQDNQSVSARGVLRGLHYQVGAAVQGKLVRVTAGEIFDVAVDLRRSSPTFGHWTGVTLRAESRQQLWVPEGFAHGFQALSEHAEVHYKASSYYSPRDERSLRWDEPALNIKWPLEKDPLISPKDAAAPGWNQAEFFA